MDAALSHLAMDQPETAAAALVRARDAATRAGHTATLFFIRHNEGLLEQARGRVDEARTGLRALLVEPLPPSLEAATLLALARVCQGGERIEAARAVLALEVDSDEHAIPAAELLAEALEKQGDLAGALAATKDLYRRTEARYEVRHRRSLDLLRVQYEVRTLREKAAELAEANARLRVLNREKDELLAIIGHDLRSPLTAMMMIADRLQQAPPPQHTVTFACCIPTGGRRSTPT
jgi:signal transduction histidine kinase